MGRGLPSSPRRRRRRARAAGFTLVELLIVFAVTVIGLLGALAVLVTVMKGQMHARSLGEAVSLAQDKLEALRAMPLPLLASSEERALGANGLPDQGGPYTRTTIVDPAGGAVLLHVQVSWSGGDGSVRSISFHSARTP